MYTHPTYVHDRLLTMKMDWTTRTTLDNQIHILIAHADGHINAEERRQEDNIRINGAEHRDTMNGQRYGHCQ